MISNANLIKAKRMKNDEFYTQLIDIRNELIHYKQHLKNKIIYCNCDDPTWSAFWKYFHLNFSTLGLKKLISTHYDKTEPTYKMEYEGGDDNDIEVGIKTPLEGNGDFRNQECLDLLDEADIVVTNPPFSLFREYVAVLMEHEKKFLIIGNQNAVSYKKFFPLIKNNQVWYGYSIHSGGVDFQIPDDYKSYSKNVFIKDGHHYINLSGIRWFTNLDHSLRHEKLILWKNYTAEEYPDYENYDAINVDTTKNIPCDYDGVMGVPITFLDKYNPDQFEIIELGIVGSCDFKNNREMIILDKNGNETSKHTFNANGTLYRKHLPTDKKPAAFKDVETGELYQSIYARILIRKKKIHKLTNIIF